MPPVKRSDAGHSFLAALEASVRGYLGALDESLSLLSHRAEGELANLPSWALTNRRVILGAPPDARFGFVRIIEEPSLDHDIFVQEEAATNERLRELAAPANGEPVASFEIGPFGIGPDAPFQVLGDMFMLNRTKTLTPPLVRGREMCGFGGAHNALAYFTEERGKQEAVNLWNTRKQPLGAGGEVNFVMNAQNTFDRFSSMVRRRAFLERRIHRFLAGNAALLLPSHQRQFSDHELRSGDEVRVADLILEQEVALPSLLIELESPTHKIVTKKGEWSAAVNHARAQIADWDRLIQTDPERNASGEMSFLLGKRDRLVIIGRGLEHREQLLRSRHTDTTIWTYDLMLEQARKRWNDTIAEQQRVVGLPIRRPF
jgi:hypothetical protein